MTWSRLKHTPAPRELAVFAGAAVLTLGLLSAADRLGPDANIQANGWSDVAVFRGFGPYHAEKGSRAGSARSELRIGGLWSSSPVRVRLDIATQRPTTVRVDANGQPSHEARVGNQGAPLAFSARSDPSGVLSVRIHCRGVNWRISRVEVHQEGPPSLPRGRLVLYGLVAPLWLFVWRRLAGGWKNGLVWLAVLVPVLSAGIALARLQLLVCLPWLVAGLAFLAAWRALADLGSSLVPLPAGAASWIAFALLLRLGFILNPEFKSIDALFHVHRAWQFHAGSLITSDAPADKRVVPVPYPPALYVLVSPLMSERPREDERLIRLVMGLLECAQPLLLFAIMRAAGASRDAAAAGAVAAAVMPEGLLVLAKGIAANILGSSVSLLALLALLRRASLPLIAALLVLALLSHFGVALCLTGLLLVWWAGQLAWRERSPADIARLAAALALAAVAAWLAYYREVWSLLDGVVSVLASEARDGPVAFFRVRWVVLGKLLQDLVLKFGGLPLFLAARGFTSGAAPAALRRLLVCWLATGLALAAAAVFTPVPLRFEYFLVPCIAAAAGLGAERLQHAGAARGVALAWAATLALQAALGFLLLTGRFRPINVILESTRWPLASSLFGVGT